MVLMGVYFMEHVGLLFINHLMLKILQARLQQYMNCKLLDVQAGFKCKLILAGYSWTADYSNSSTDIWSLPFNLLI